MGNDFTDDGFDKEFYDEQDDLEKFYKEYEEGGDYDEEYWVIIRFNNK